MEAGSPLAPITLRLVDGRRERLERVDQLQQVLSAAMLVLASARRLRAPGHGAWGWAAAETAAAAALIALILREWRGGRRGGERIGRVDLLAGLTLLAEWGNRFAHGGKLVSPVLLTALIALAMAFVRAPLMARRSVLRIDDEGVRLRLSRLRQSRVTWAQVQSLRVAGHDLCFARADGGEQWLRLARLKNGSEVIHLVSAHARARGMPVTGTPE